MRFTSSHSQKKDNNQFKNKIQIELPENQTVWKANNQGVKETFIQTGRRNGDRKPGQRGPVTRWQLEDWGGRDRSWWTSISHIHMWISWKEQLGSETDSEIQDFSVGNQRLKTYGYKERWRLWWPEKLPVSQESPLEGPTGS